MNPSNKNNKKSSNPTHEEVCTGRTGYAEVVKIQLTDSKYFEDVVRFFFGIHDPTTKNRQGADRGSQYASFIFCSDPKQIEIVERVKKELQGLIDCRAIQCFAGKTVQTRVVMMTDFVEATEKHQDYLLKHPNGYW